jgi:hypothetical protein
LLDFRFAGEQFILVDQLGASRDEALAGDWNNGLDKVRIQIATRGGTVVGSPEKVEAQLPPGVGLMY